MMNEPSGAAPTKNTGAKITHYALGSTDRERQRLMRQGAFLRDITATAFRAAGIGPGMRVLDIGSGVGDVALLAAELAGPTGSVVGLDRDMASVEWANRRAAEAGVANVSFCATEFSDFSDVRPFDALVGRFILLYLPDPAATLRHLASMLRSGGIVAFHEPDFTEPGKCLPVIPLVDQCNSWICETLRRTGARLDMGMRLHQTYREAGFVGTTTMVAHLSGCGVRREMVEFFTETVRSILPKMEQCGIATREEVQIETLADRLEADGHKADPQWIGARYVCAWARKP